MGKLRFGFLFLFSLLIWFISEITIHLNTAYLNGL